MHRPGPFRLSCQLAALALTGSLQAGGQGWLGDLKAPEPVPGPAGLVALEPALVPYVHPFAAQTRAQLAGHTAAAPVAGTTYLLRGRPGHPDPRHNRASLRHQALEVQRAGYRLLGAVPQGGVPFTPLVGVATYGTPAGDVLATPFMETIPTQGGRVQVSLLALPPGAGEPRELVLYGSGTLPPAELLELAGRVHAELATTWFPGPVVTRAELRAKLGPAVEQLHEADDSGLIVAVRVLWDTAAGPIPGVGGVLVKAADPAQAFPRLYALYEGAAR